MVVSELGVLMRIMILKYKLVVWRCLFSLIAKAVVRRAECRIEWGIEKERRSTRGFLLGVIALVVEKEVCREFDMDEAIRRNLYIVI